ALDNAIESVLKIEDVEKRIISIVVEKRGKLVNISIENYYIGNLVFHNGIPHTSKQEESRHGFGIKSIKYIATKMGRSQTSIVMRLGKLEGNR
nr:GHKL domain-containing protein [Muribaculaceae bacterium]